MQKKSKKSWNVDWWCKRLLPICQKSALKMLYLPFTFDLACFQNNFCFRHWSLKKKRNSEKFWNFKLKLWNTFISTYFIVLKRIMDDEAETYKLWRIRKTVMALCHDRGYLVRCVNFHHRLKFYCSISILDFLRLL